MCIRDRIKAFRRQLGLQANKLAEELNISPSYLNLIEGGKRKIDGDLLLKICEKLNIELSQLTSKTDLNLENTLSEILDDELFEDLDILGPEVKDLVGTNPKIGKAIVRLGDILKKKDHEIINKIEKISVQANQLHNKIIKISTKITPQERNLEIIEQTKPKVEQNFIDDQLELNIKGKNNDHSEKAFQNNFLSWDMLLKALNFPNDENDLEGFTALNLARENNTIFQLLQVSEDFLNLLAQDGIYLDDLKIDPPSVNAWVNFINNKQNEH
mgnify:CR=1 FL=1